MLIRLKRNTARMQGKTSDRLGGRGGGKRVWKRGMGDGIWGTVREEERKDNGNGDGDELNRVRKSKRDQICQDRKWRILVTGEPVSDL
jgi:hypothetical protein